MVLHRQSGVSVESWVTLTANVPMSYEADPVNDEATLFFGHDNVYVLALKRDVLAQLVSLGAQAIAELETSVGAPKGTFAT